ncbi:unnamed protein product [Rhodiola kirilowii]
MCTSIWQQFLYISHIHIFPDQSIQIIHEVHSTRTYASYLIKPSRFTFPDAATFLNTF